MANKRTKERHENIWLDDIDKLEIQSKKMRDNASKGKSYHGKQHQEYQVKKNRLSNAPKAKAKWSFVENKKTGAKAKEKWIIENEKIGGKTPASGRTTWNSRCETDIGVFDQVTNYKGKKTRNSTATAMTDDNVSSKRNNRNNVETNGQTTSNTYSSMEQETVVMNIKQENPTDDQDEEIHIIEEKVVKTPATVMKVKQEKQSYQPKVLITLINENNEKNNQALVQPTRELSGNEQICASKETLISTRTDKYPAGASAFPSITRLPQRPGPNKTSHSLYFNQSGLTITPVGPSAANSLSTSSEARETTRRIHYGATRSRRSSPDCNGSGDNNGTTPSQNTSPVNNELSQNGTTPVVPSATKSSTRYIHYGATISQRNSPANDRSEDHTGRAQDGATISSGDITGCSQDGATISQRNTQANDRSEDNNGHTQDAAKISLVNNRSLDVSGRSQDEATASQSNSQVNNRTGDDTGRSPDGVTASQSNFQVNNRRRDDTGRSQVGATASHGNSCNERRDTAERVNNEATNQITRSHGNLTINIGGGNLTVNNGGLTAQMKIHDVSMTGPADDVTNFVIEATRAVRDLVN